jgi:endoglucanase
LNVFKKKVDILIRLTAVALFASLFLSACQTKPNDVPGVAQTQPACLSMETQPILFYEVPTMRPSVLVNQDGYDRLADKDVLVYGSNLPDVFRVIDQETDQIVYTGELIDGAYNTQTGEYNRVGDFSDVTTAGNYYIECDLVGRSYSFTIQDETLVEVQDTAMRRMEECILQFAENGRLAQAPVREEALQSLYVLLLSYELFPAIFQARAAQDIPMPLDVTSTILTTLLLTEDAKTQDSSATQPQPWETSDYAYLYATVLAKYSYLYQNYNDVDATAILNMADRAWRYAEQEFKKKNTEQATQSEQYRMAAAAELYRATGRYLYRNAFMEYGDQYLQQQVATVEQTNVTTPTDDFYHNMAKITYLSTNQRVNVTLCNIFIQQLMEQTEAVARKAQTSTPPAGFATFEQADQTFEDMILLTMVGYAIMSNEYQGFARDCYDYMCGQNPQSYCYFVRVARDETQATQQAQVLADAGLQVIQIEDDPLYLSAFVLMLSPLCEAAE